MKVARRDGGGSCQFVQAMLDIDTTTLLHAAASADTARLEELLLALARHRAAHIALYFIR